MMRDSSFEDERKSKTIVAKKIVMVAGRKIWIIRMVTKAQITGNKLFFIEKNNFTDLIKRIRNKTAEKIPLSVAKFKRNEEEEVKKTFQFGE